MIRIQQKPALEGEQVLKINNAIEERNLTLRSGVWRFFTCIDVSPRITQRQAEIKREIKRRLVKEGILK